MPSLSDVIAGTIRLGEATNSYDADGDITDTLPWQHVTLEELQQEAHKTFLGDLQQIPPMFSALRVKGKRLYESAREGKVVERAARSVHVSQFDLTQDQTDPQQVHFYISCSKGTYIRSLAHDLVRHPFLHMNLYCSGNCTSDACTGTHALSM